MSNVNAANTVWVRPLGSAWKVRVGSAEMAETLRAALAADGWKCTAVTAAFDVASTVLFRATDLGGNRDRDLRGCVDRLGAYALHTEPA